MLIGGLQKTSLQDYPGKISAIIFTQGCNFRCPFCYNPELVTRINKKNIFKQKDIFNFLNTRKKKLDAVVITGGEPTQHPSLPRFIKKIKDMDYLIKLDTNGSHPEMLKELIDRKLIDYIAMDIKAPLSKYSQVVNRKVNKRRIKKSIKLIMRSGLPYEFRSTLLPELHSQKDLIKMSKLIKGAEKYFLQKFIPSGNLNNQEFNKLKPYTDAKMKELAELSGKYVKMCQAR
jgi:pyruvate formate lyase activating enzyme